MSRRFVEENPGCHGCVDGIGSGTQRDADNLVGLTRHLVVKPGPFTSDQQGDGAPKVRLGDGHRTPSVGGDDSHACPTHPPEELCGLESLDDRKPEDRTRRSPRGLRVRRVYGALDRHKRRCSERLRAANHRSNVSRLLHAAGDDEESVRCSEQSVEIGRSQLHERRQALRRLGGGDFRE
ncbi:MAG: hypothetical protein DMG22_09065 [Acidobacteria bacterium]|nr:MAG: hypothetical protein DMG22_09065 [Acidobacteriota bacterium]